MSALAEKTLAEAYAITEKQQRYAKIGEIKTAVARGAAPAGDAPKFTADQVGTEFFNLEYRLVRERILDGQPRIDGRDTKTVRPINDPHRRAGAHARLGAVHARRDAGAGGHHARHRPRRADHRRR